MAGFVLREMNVDNKEVKITHGAWSHIGTDGRSVEVLRAENGSFQVEWSNREPGNGNAYISTKVVLSQEAMAATLRCVMAITETIEAEKADAA